MDAHEQDAMAAAAASSVKATIATNDGPTEEMTEFSHGRSAEPSPFMAREAERAHMTGLSPIEEMRLAQNELTAKAAAQLVRRG